jgi:uncharacterized damage-inducible protein DinB
MSNRAMLIAALQATPRDLARALRPVTPGQAARRPAPDAWTIAAVVAHLAEMEERFLGRLRQVAAEDNPAVAALHPDEARHDLDRPLDALLAAFAERRTATVAFLESLDQRAWNRPLLHPEGGPSTLREQVRNLVGHDNDHLAQIATIREQLEQ